MVNNRNKRIYNEVWVQEQNGRRRLEDIMCVCEIIRLSLFFLIFIIYFLFFEVSFCPCVLT